MRADRVQLLDELDLPFPIPTTFVIDPRGEPEDDGWWNGLLVEVVPRLPL